jgi:hypothetical protein
MRLNFPMTLGKKTQENYKIYQLFKLDEFEKKIKAINSLNVLLLRNNTTRYATPVLVLSVSKERASNSIFD